MPFTKRKVLISVLCLSWLLFAISIDHNLFLKFRNFKESDSLNQEHNEELGGSLFEAVSPNSARKGDILENPSKHVINTVIEQISLDIAIDNINKPSIDYKPLAKVENKMKTKNSNRKTIYDSKKTDDESKKSNYKDNNQM